MTEAPVDRQAEELAGPVELRAAGHAGRGGTGDRDPGAERDRADAGPSLRARSSTCPTAPTRWAAVRAAVGVDRRLRRHRAGGQEARRDARPTGAGRGGRAFASAQVAPPPARTGSTAGCAATEAESALARHCQAGDAAWALGAATAATASAAPAAARRRPVRDRWRPCIWGVTSVGWFARDVLARRRAAGLPAADQRPRAASNGCPRRCTGFATNGWRTAAGRRIRPSAAGAPRPPRLVHAGAELAVVPGRPPPLDELQARRAWPPAGAPSPRPPAPGCRPRRRPCSARRPRGRCRSPSAGRGAGRRRTPAGRRGAPGTPARSRPAATRAGRARGCAPSGTSRTSRPTPRSRRRARSAAGRTRAA